MSLAATSKVRGARWKALCERQAASGGPAGQKEDSSKQRPEAAGCRGEETGQGACRRCCEAQTRVAAKGEHSSLLLNTPAGEGSGAWRKGRKA